MSRTNPHLRSPFKKDFGKRLYDMQRKTANFKDGSLMRVRHPGKRI